MSIERVKKILSNFGFTKTEAEVYLYLAKTGPQRGSDIASRLRITKQQLYPTLKSLKKKGIATSRPERAALFSVLTFDGLLNHYIKLGVEQAKSLKIKKQELVDNWEDITRWNNGQKQ